MDQSNLLPIAFLAVLGNAIIIYLVFSEAVKAKRRDRYLLIQAKILVEIAKQQGVDPVLLDKIVTSPEV